MHDLSVETASGGGLLFAVLLDGEGGARELDWGGVQAWAPEQGFLWVHMDYRAPGVREWLRDGPGLDDVLIDALCAEATRPRSSCRGEGLLVNLRAINPASKGDPDEMVAFRLWLDGRCAVSLRHRQLKVPHEVRDALLGGRGPSCGGGLLVELCARIFDPLSELVSSIDDEADDIEEKILGGEARELRPKISDLRRRAIGLRRFLAPQRDAMGHLDVVPVEWLADRERLMLRELGDRLLRFVEELDSVRDRAAVTQEELSARLAESMNRTMYVLSIVTAIFLPLGLLTGLLGVNVGGMPGVESEQAFTYVCVFMGAVALALWEVFRRKRLL
jgi:zinc transporter